MVESVWRLVLVLESVSDSVPLSSWLASVRLSSEPSSTPIPGGTPFATSSRTDSASAPSTTTTRPRGFDSPANATLELRAAANNQLAVFFIGVGSAGEQGPPPPPLSDVDHELWLTSRHLRGTARDASRRHGSKRVGLVVGSEAVPHAAHGANERAGGAELLAKAFDVGVHGA